VVFVLTINVVRYTSHSEIRCEVGVQRAGERGTKDAVKELSHFSCIETYKLRFACGTSWESLCITGSPYWCFALFSIL
jgi:hypothetical protein